MLDDLKYIHELDAADALGVAERQYRQLQHSFELPKIKGSFENIVVAGMGGSALAAQLSTTWPGYNVPFEICRNYTIPNYVSAHTLFVASSYSGNTEETLEALTRAEEQGATIAVISAGGELVFRAQEKNYPLARLPNDFQPRHAVLYNFAALMQIFSAASIFDAEKIRPEIEQAANHIKEIAQDWRADVPTSKNRAKQIALELAGKSPVIYGSPLMFPAAYKWKINFNENAKNVAWCNQIPEFNHNEFLGWTSHPVDKPYGVIDLRSSFDHSRVAKRFEVTARLLSGRRPESIALHAEGETVFQQLVWHVVLGDFVSLYLALLNGLNPMPVDLIEKFKKSLDD